MAKDKIKSNSIKNSSEQSSTVKPVSERKARLSQNDVPSYNLTDSLKISRAIVEQYASKPTAPIDVARALDMQPTSSSFRMLCGASIAYGLTLGGYNASLITLEDLSIRILKPLSEDDDHLAQREAFLKPRVIKEFLEKYNGHSLPRNDIAQNMLETLGVPRNRTEEVFGFITITATGLGLIIDIKGKKHVHLANKIKPENSLLKEETNSLEFEEEENNSDISNNLSDASIKSPIHSNTPKPIFIGHGKKENHLNHYKKYLIPFMSHLK